MRRGTWRKLQGQGETLSWPCHHQGSEKRRPQGSVASMGLPGVGTARRGVYRGGGTCHAADQLQIRLLGRWRQDSGGLEVRWSLFTLDVVGPR